MVGEWVRVVGAAGLDSSRFVAGLRCPGRSHCRLSRHVHQIIPGRGAGWGGRDRVSLSCVLYCTGCGSASTGSPGEYLGPSTHWG